MSEPVFVVVGHVNRGKSSIVSTLAADDSVGIDAYPGTTTHNRTFPMRIGGRTLYTLIDTPGFERARQALAWLQERATATADRRATVEQFLATHENSGEFRQECELLRPIMAGGAILYVVDGSVPFSPHYEAEMEILRWTTQPRMALINRIRQQDHTAAWRSVLDQYFSLSREFDAHAAGFEHRLRLLRALRELREDWHAPLDEAIGRLVEDRHQRARDSAMAIAELLADVVTHVEQEKLATDVDPEPCKPKLAERYFEHLRSREQRSRQELMDVYQHRVLEVRETGIAAVEGDLFNLATWSRLGLSRRQMDAAATAAGALLGGAVDVAVGGASFLLGAAIGSAVGFVGSRLAWDRLVEVRVMGQSLGGRLLQIGPMTNPRFPWVVLDRAMLYHEVVANRAHAKRDAIELATADEQAGRVAKLPADVRNRLEALFTRLRKGPSPEAKAQIREQITDELTPLLNDAPR